MCEAMFSRQHKAYAADPAQTHQQSMAGDSDTGERAEAS